MNTNTIISKVQSPKWVESSGEKLQPLVLKAFESGGKAGRQLKNFLHGVWLGHPLHPMLTDVPIGAYTVTAVMDVLELSGDKRYQAGADAALTIGMVGAGGAALTGITDWTGTSGQNRRIGMMHAVLNVGATLLNGLSLVLRRKKATRPAAIGCSLAAYAVTTLAAYLGGHLVYGEHMGVDHTGNIGAYPLSFTDVLADKDLPEGKMIGAQAGDIPVLLVRQHGRIHALVNICSHLGGPLNEGQLLEDGCVKCPWHGSVFNLETGDVVEGPATAPQTKLETRVVQGRIQVKLANKELVKKMDTLDQIS